MPDGPEGYGEAVRNLAPQPIVQAFFLLVYAVWWALAWPVWGTVAFGLTIAYAITGIGGALATGAYASYILREYDALARQGMGRPPATPRR